MEALFILVRGLAAGVLLPALAASAAAAWAAGGGRARRLALTGVFVLVSVLGALITSGMLPATGVQSLVELMRGVRALPPEQFPAMVAPPLNQLATQLVAASGRPPAPDAIPPVVARMVAVLAEVRALPQSEFEREAPALVARLLDCAHAGGVAAALAWSPAHDGALVVPLAAGLTGGIGVGLTTGAFAAAFRAQIAGLPPAHVLPTLLAGALGGLAAAWCARGGAGRAFALGMAAGVAQAAWVAACAPSSHAVPPALVTGGVFALLQATGLAVFALIAGSQRLAAEHRRLQQAQLQARLDLLAAQVRPHFLFNALNTIAATVGEAERCRHLIGCLARFLRLALKPGEGRIRLEDELANLEPYLELERERYSDRLRIDVDADGASRARLLPALVLQPLIENAVVHGFRANGEPLAVAVRARVDGAALVVTVADDGAGVPPARLAALARGDGMRIGLSSVFERVERADPPGRVHARETPGGGLTVEMRIPAAREAGA